MGKGKIEMMMTNRKLSKIEENRKIMRQKTGGRKAQTPNRTTTEMRNIFNSLLSNNLDGIEADLEKLDPLQRITMILKISEFVLPKLQSTQMEIATTNKPRTVIKWGDKEIEI